MSEMETKTCTKCKRTLPVGEFTFLRSHKEKAETCLVVAQCWDCRVEGQRDRARKTNHAYAKVRRALAKGILVKRGCLMCTKYGMLPETYPYQDSIQAHHCDYGKPLDVMWLCYAHHQAWHRVFKTEDKQD